MLDALKEGYTVAITADVPKIPRVAGEGIVRLAAVSGRPLIAVALASSRRIELNTWDRAALNLPFSSIALSAAPQTKYLPMPMRQRSSSTGSSWKPISILRPIVLMRSQRLYERYAASFARFIASPRAAALFRTLAIVAH
jgi:hypothetical protein